MKTTIQLPLPVLLVAVLISSPFSTQALVVPPSLAPLTFTNGQPLVQLNGAAGSNYVIETSADLSSWQKLFAGTAAGGQLRFVHTNFGGATRLFYRARTASPGEVANPLSVIPLLDTNQSVSALITTNGGSLSLTNFDGVIFDLQIPSHALLTEETVSLTAVTNLGGVPFAAGAAGAVVVQPDSLLMLQPATLSIRGAAVATNSVSSFAFGEDGSEFHLVPDKVVPGAVEVGVLRLGGFGIGSVTRPEIKAQLERWPTSAAAQLEQTLAGALLQRRLPGTTPRLVRHGEADQALLDFYTNHMAIAFAAANGMKTLASAAAAPDVEVVLESISIFRGDTLVYHEDFPELEPDESSQDALLTSLTESVYLDSCAWARGRITELAARCGEQNAEDYTSMLVLADWVDFQCSEDSDWVRDQLSGCLGFELNFESHIITDAGEVVSDSTVHASHIPLKWDGRKTFAGTGTLVYDSFTLTPPPSPCWRDSINYTGGPFHILSLEFDLNFKKRKTPRLIMKIIPPAATESWVDHCPSPGGVVDLPMPNTTMWLGAFIISHDSNFTITEWNVTGGTTFATREFLGATIHDDAFITEASRFELIHAP